MRGFPASCLVCALSLILGCGQSERDSKSGGAGGGGQAGANGAGAGQGGNSSGGSSCANVGCAPPALCSEGCTEPCGCCPCSEGEIVTRTGQSYQCSGGCFAPAAGSSGAAWQSFRVDEGWGPCPGEEICANQWTVVPSGAVTTFKQGATSEATMPASDLEALNAIFAEPAFTNGMKDGFSCDQPPTDVAYSIVFETPSGTDTQDVTGCVLSGPASNPAERAVDLVSKY